MASPKKKTDPLSLVALIPSIKASLGAIQAGESVEFGQVTASARGFLAALVAKHFKGRAWVVVESLREQERLHLELTDWGAAVIFVPELEMAQVEGATPDPEVLAERLTAIQRFAAEPDSIVLTTVGGLGQAIPKASEVKPLRVRTGEQLDRDALVESLVQGGYSPESQVSFRGQLAVRGGILDVFSWQHGLPVRLEFFGNEVESIREFDLDDQRSVRRVESCEILTEPPALDVTCQLASCLDAADLVVNMSSSELSNSGSEVRISDTGDLTSNQEATFYPIQMGKGSDWVLHEATRADFDKQIQDWLKKNWNLTFLFQNEAEQQRFNEVYGVDLTKNKNICQRLGTLSAGFTCPAGKIAVISDAELFGRYKNISVRSRSLEGRNQFALARRSVDMSELVDGELVVHQEEGICRYEGVTELEGQEVIALEFAGEARIYVPLDQSYLLTRYIGIGKKTPPLSTLGEGNWSNIKQTAAISIFKYAEKMLEIQAHRQTNSGHAFPPDTRWQQEFEGAFLFKETEDQMRAIIATKDDMESEKPMDRLVCGDVGFGKTEVAIRAAFKCVMSGKQAALLAPTTVLAQQHFQTFQERMAEYPVVIELLSRFRTAAEQRHVIKMTAEGGVDILIGTHRLISSDVSFKELGLVVVDEEQRFGVRHKERLKERFPLVDMLTLSATPIPRTLYLALTGAKDFSTIDTPPPSRIPVETIVCPYDERVIRDAILRELKRGGQVYFLHNRIDTIFRTAARVEELCPKAKVSVGHGQMEEDQLEVVMRDFVAGKSDVLVSTTIIESGLDIPNANTIIIDRADRFGLADLYQLRGRVGRSNHKAYAYLMVPRELATKESRQRIGAIKQYSTLGAGFRIAMRDLEIRGAGNLLGTAQSGHITAVGFDLYCRMLKQAVARIKGEKVTELGDVRLYLDFVEMNEAQFLKSAGDNLPVFLPIDFVRDAEMRVRMYRELAEAESMAEIARLEVAWVDRFGKLPEAVGNLLHLARIRSEAASRRIDRIDVEETKVKIRRRGDFVMVNGKFPRLTSRGSLPNFREVLTLIAHL